MAPASRLGAALGLRQPVTVRPRNRCTTRLTMASTISTWIAAEATCMTPKPVTQARASNRASARNIQHLLPMVDVGEPAFAASQMPGVALKHGPLRRNE